MGTECITAILAEDSEETPSVPPGFAPLVLVRCTENDTSSLANVPSSMQNPEEAPCSTFSGEKCRKSLRNRSLVDYSQFGNSSDEEGDVEPIDKRTSSGRRIPKGVLRGCSGCKGCQNVVAKWCPDASCSPVLEEAPVFHPTEEEFRDTVRYIESIRSIAEPYGICRIVPPTSWKPPCLLKQKDVWQTANFATRVQKIDQLQNRKPVRKMPRSQQTRKRRKVGNANESVEAVLASMHESSERFGFEPGPDFTLESFQKYADDFFDKYFKTATNKDFRPSVENIEGEYWRIVERPTHQIEVLYGADLDSATFGSGFPKSTQEQSAETEDPYAKSCWNLNNLPRLSGSLLSFEGAEISGVLVPWVYVGMCFSSFCWHVEDHHLYSLNYLHWGAPKMWYGVPGNDALKLETAMRKHLPHLFEEQPNLLHNLTTQFSPSLLKSEGVPVYRCTQHEGEFVLTFPRAYHAGFNCGFNCAEAVNVAPVDWLPHGQHAVELYREQHRKITVSHDRLLLGAAKEAVKAQWEITFFKKMTQDNLRWKNVCGSDGILTKTLKTRVDSEHKLRDSIASASQLRKMDAGFDETDRECAECHYDLHLSAVGCSCNPERFVCLVHAKELCSCDFSARCFLFRYEINELNMLIDALGGKLSAIHRWSRSDLRLSLGSYVRKGKAKESKASEGQDCQNGSLSGNSACDTKKHSVCHESKVILLYPPVADEKNKEKRAPSPENTKNVNGERNDRSSKQEEKINVDDKSKSQILPNVATAGNTKSCTCHASDNSMYNIGSSQHWERTVSENSLYLHAPTVSHPRVPANNIVCFEQTLDQNFVERPNESIHRWEAMERHDFGGVGTSFVQSHDTKYGRVQPPCNHNTARRFSVEVLDFGMVLPGKMWSTAQAIYPRGYKSRVKYMNITDPTQVCYYICEILGSEPSGPVFKVTVEGCSSQSFVCNNATQCWEMIRTRLNREITRQQCFGRTNLPTILPPGSVDGLEMFGLLSTEILQVIEQLDVNRICSEYWRCKQYAVAGGAWPTQAFGPVTENNRQHYNHRDCASLFPHSAQRGSSPRC